MRALGSLLRRLALAPALLAAAALFGLMAMTFADVILRSALDSPIQAATELTRIAMALIVFAALPVISARGGHISVDLLDPLFGPWAARLRDSLMSLLCGAMLWLPAERALVLAERARDYGDVTEYLRIPQFYVAGFVALSVFVTSAVLVIRGLVILFAPHLLPTRDD